MRETSVELIKYAPLSKWKPELGDFVIYHAMFWNRWFGVINNIGQMEVEVIKEGLPYLLVTMSPGDQEKNKMMISIAKIKSSRGGTYAVMQNGVLYIDG